MSFYLPRILESAKERAPETFSTFNDKAKEDYWSHRLKFVFNHYDAIADEWAKVRLKMRNWSPVQGAGHTDDLIIEEANLTIEMKRLIEQKNECMVELAALTAKETEELDGR